jgi:hypothetical protein
LCGRLGKEGGRKREKEKEKGRRKERRKGGGKERRKKKEQVLSSVTAYLLGLFACTPWVTSSVSLLSYWALVKLVSCVA